MTKTKSENGISKPVTLETLGEFTEQVILPGVEKMIAPLEEKVVALEAKIDGGFTEMRHGFSAVNKSMRTIF